MKKRITRVMVKHEKWYVAYVREIPGVNTLGRTVAEARRNLKEALSMAIEANREFAAKRTHV